MDTDILALHGHTTERGGVPNLLAFIFGVAQSTERQHVPLIIICDQVKSVHTIASLLSSFIERPIYTYTPHTYATHYAYTLRPGDVIVGHSALAEERALPSPQEYIRQIKHIRTHDTLRISEFSAWCTTAGYTRNTTADTAGTYAHRGEIFDIYLDEPIRIIFDGDIVSDIYSIDYATGHRITTRTLVDIPPYALQGSCTLYEVVPEHTRVVGWNTHIPPISLPHIRVHTLPDATYTRFQRLPSYEHRLHELANLATKYTHHSIISEHPERCIGLLNVEKPRSISYAIESDGCVDTITNTALYTDHTLGIQHQQAKVRKKKVPVILTLKPGDYAVHLFHGIGKFIGMTHMEVNAIMHEYFIIEYAKGDKIYVPVQLADYLDTYIGDSHPTLSRLSDASWHEVVARVKAQALDMARDLLHAYARRSIAQAPILLPIDEEHQLNALCEFELTTDQQRALEEVFHDVQSTTPMDRLLCGDVGFGKTEIALRLAFRAAFHHQQVALLAPTTILAQQHADNFIQRLSTFGIQVAALSRFQSPKEQKEILRGIEHGTIDIVIGTHRLLSKDVRWKQLGVIIVDEEQRFGVKAKEGLQRYRSHAHVLTMTATPIPRTLNLSLSGIRDISTILTAPRERKAIELHIEQYNLPIIQEAISRELKRSGQIYYIYNRVQGIEIKKQDIQNLFPDARIGIAHGQLEEKELAHIMHAFDAGEIDILLATTIVENGLDIPRANTIIVEQASQFGLSELYQLKGRVGRSTIQGYALMLYSESQLDVDAAKRLTALAESHTLGAGFELALRDMEIRGVGNILGKQQHGHAVKIGLNLYGRLLNQAVAELDGNPEPPERDIPIDLPLSARIPEALYPSMEERITLYQELANIADIDDLRARRLRYTHLPEEFAGLFDLLEIKLIAARSPLLSIETTYPSSHNQLTSPRITITSQRPLPQLSSAWELVYTKTVGQFRVRAHVAELGASWIEELKHTLRSL